MDTAIKTFAIAAQKRVGFWEMLIPIFMELLQALMEQCANTEEQAVKLMTDPTPPQQRLMHRRMLLKLHSEAKEIPIMQRNAVAWQSVYAGLEVAAENPDVVVAAFRERQAARN